jgi:hypothetical protein
MFLIFLGVIVILILTRLIAYRVSLIRERERIERIEIERVKRNRIWSEHLERAKERKMKSE